MRQLRFGCSTKFNFQWVNQQNIQNIANIGTNVEKTYSGIDIINFPSAENNLKYIYRYLAT